MPELQRDKFGKPLRTDVDGSFVEKAAKERAAEDAELKKLFKEKEGGNKKAKILGISAGAVAVVVIGMIFIGPLLTNQNIVAPGNNGTMVPVPTLTSQPTETIPAVTGTPITLKQWQSSLFSSQDQANLRTTIIGELKTSELLASARNLPSEEAGYFTDPTKASHEDGSVDSLYSPLTKESFSFESRKGLERMVNPIFGGWLDYQNNWNSDNSQKFYDSNKDLFTNGFLKKNSAKNISKWGPFAVDWKNDKFGKSETIAENANWFGQIQSTKTKFQKNKSHKLSMKLTANVIFSAFAKDGSVLKKNAVLTLTIVSNTGKYDSNRTTLIDNATFKWSK